MKLLLRFYFSSRCAILFTKTRRHDVQNEYRCKLYRGQVRGFPNSNDYLRNNHSRRLFHENIFHYEVKEERFQFSLVLTISYSRDIWQLNSNSNIRTLVYKSCSFNIEKSAVEFERLGDALLFVTYKRRGNSQSRVDLLLRKKQSVQRDGVVVWFVRERHEYSAAEYEKPINVGKRAGTRENYILHVFSTRSSFTSKFSNRLREI